MNIGLVTPRYPPNVEGGGEISARLLAENLPKDSRVSEVTVLAFDGSGIESRGGVQILRLGKVSPQITEWQNLRAYYRLRSYVDKFDVIHAYNMELHPAAGALGDFHNVPTVGTLNSYHFFPSSVAHRPPSLPEKLYELLGHPTTGRILEHFVKNIDVLIALSTAVKSIYVEHGYDSRNIEVIPNMIDPSFSVPDNISTDGATILYVGTLAKMKGVEYLIRAIPKLPSEYHLRIVGDGPQRDELVSLANELGITYRVTFVGNVQYENIPEQFAMADIFVHPGVWPEPFGRTVLEAMQCGLPVVCTDIGGPADLVSESNLRCEPKNSEALADAIQWGYENMSEIKLSPLDHIVSKYSPKSVVTDVVDIYSEL